MQKPENQRTMSLEEANELSDDELKEIVEECADVEVFSDMFFEHIKYKTIGGTSYYVPTPYYHTEIRDAIDGDEDCNIIVARGHGKTTAIWIKFIHMLIYQPQETILYIASESLGEEVIGKIMYELENNKLLIAVYGNLVPANSEDMKDKRLKKWRSKKLELLNGGDIMTLTKGQSVRGKRRKLVVLDDPQENKDVRNKAIVDRFNEWVFSSLYNTMLPGGRMITVGTIIGNMCLVKHLRDNLGRYTIEYKAVENGEALRPEMRSLEELQERKEAIGTPLFNQEFLNIPYSYEERVISEAWIRRGGEHITENMFDYKVLSIDPAISTKESADFIGLCAMGYYEEDRVVLYSAQKKMKMEELAELIVSLHETRAFNKIRVENVAFQKMLADMLKKRGLPIELVTPHKDKYTRLMEVAHYLEFGKVFFRKKGDEELIYQLTNFPDVEHDDIMDAFVYCLMTKQGGFKIATL